MFSFLWTQRCYLPLFFLGAIKKSVLCCLFCLELFTDNETYPFHNTPRHSFRAWFLLFLFLSFYCQMHQLHVCFCFNRVFFLTALLWSLGLWSGKNINIGTGPTLFSPVSFDSFVSADVFAPLTACRQGRLSKVLIEFSVGCGFLFLIAWILPRLNPIPRVFILHWKGIFYCRPPRSASIKAEDSIKCLENLLTCYAWTWIWIW